jgi:hypothetical protein
MRDIRSDEIKNLDGGILTIRHASMAGMHLRSIIGKDSALSRAMLRLLINGIARMNHQKLYSILLSNIFILIFATLETLKHLKKWRR